MKDEYDFKSDISKKNKNIAAKKSKGLKIVKAPCEDCKGALNDQGKHVDCRTCDNTGIK